MANDVTKMGENYYLEGKKLTWTTTATTNVVDNADVCARNCD